MSKFLNYLLTLFKIKIRGDNIRHILDKSKPQVEFIEYSMRFYGQPKLSKPKELKGVKQVSTISYIANKCTCPLYILGDDVWIKHNDYFSSCLQPSKEDIEEINGFITLGYMCKKYLGKTRKEKFIYADNFASIVLRNEAWILLKNIMTDVNDSEVHELRILNSIIKQVCEHCKIDEIDLDREMERFYEKVVRYLHREYFK